MQLRSSQSFSLKIFPRLRLTLSGHGPKKHFKTLVIGLRRQVMTLVTGPKEQLRTLVTGLKEQLMTFKKDLATLLNGSWMLARMF